MVVYVLNKHGNPLMPCSPRKARLLLKEAKAKVVKRTPFTIQLLYGSYGYKQTVTLGIDKGAKETGISCVGNGKVLLSAQINHRTDISGKIGDRAGLRRARRNRKWYRPARFNNRASMKAEGRLAPSVKANAEEVIRVVCKIPLPITQVVVEDVLVDTAAINNPDLQGTDYQNPTRLHENLRLATLLRDKFTCQLCKKKNNSRLEAHHIVFRANGGLDSLDNLITLCSTCHAKVHSGKASIAGGVSNHLHAIAMHTMQGKTFLYTQLEGFFGHLEKAFGYQTSQVRKYFNLPKEHDVDAFCLAVMQTQLKGTWSRDNYYQVSLRARQTRRVFFSQPRKGVGRVRYQVNEELAGFRKGDIVLVKGKFVKQITSIYSNGSLAFARVPGEPASVKPKHCRLIEKQKTVVWRMAA